MKLLGVFGAGGFGREVMPLLVEHINNCSAQSAAPRVVFVDDGRVTNEVCGYPVLSFDEFCHSDAQTKQIAIAIGNSNARKSIHIRMLENNVSPFSIWASSSIQLQNAQIGEGSILCPFTCITSDVKIGKFFQLNLYSYVSHDCSIGDFVTFAPGVKCNGHVVIEDDVYIGAGAIIKQGRAGRPLVIGKGAKIEAGSYVTKDVEPGATVFGSPAIKMSLSNLRRIKSTH
jgi:sugar O-acyltransferase (sialic acid O-acetyltransferase NeuD family)